MQTISASLDVVEKWEDRIEKLKILRSIVFAGVDHYKDFWNLMKSMSRQLEKTVSVGKDKLCHCDFVVRLC